MNQDMDIRLRATVNSLDRSLVGPFHFQAMAYLSTVTSGSGLNFHSPLPYLKCPPLSRIKISAFAGATTGSPRLDVGLTVLLVSQI